jgi:hypothetical protein
MQNDAEKLFYQAVAKIDGLESQVEQLSEQMEQFTLSGFQEQIDALNKKISEASDILLETRRFVATHEVDDLGLFLHQWIGLNLLDTSPLLYSQVRDFLLVESTKATQAIKQSPTPITIARQFRRDCTKYFKERNLAAFRD